MTIVPVVKIETASSDYAHVGYRVVRVLANMVCPRCLRGRLHANAWREIGDGQFAWTCLRCHSDIVTIE